MPPDDPSRRQFAPVPRQLTLDLGREPDFATEDFLVAAPNADAFALIGSWPDWPTSGVIVVGPPGSGKTHLATMWAREAHARIIRPGDVLDPERLETYGAVLLEDCDRAGHTEAMLFHSLNLIRERQGWLMLTARKHPSQWAFLTPDLVSRLRLALAVEIGSADPELIRSVLVKLFHDRQIRVDRGVITYAALHLEQSMEAVIRFVKAVDDTSLAAGRRITRSLAAITIARLIHEGDTKD